MKPPSGLDALVRSSTRLLVIAVFLLAGMTPACAGTVVASDGTRLEGEILPQDDGVLVVRRPEQSRRIRLADAVLVTMSDLPAEPLSDLVALNVPPRVSSEHAVPLQQAADDALNGRIGMHARPGDLRERPHPWLTDARSPAQPAQDNGWLAGSVTWDLGCATPAEQRQLDRISIWINASDPARGDYSGSWAVSTNGEVFTEIPGSAREIIFPRDGRDGQFNHIVYALAPGQLTRFRYLRLTARVPEGGQETRFVEVDAFVSRAQRAPDLPACVLTCRGTRLFAPSVRVDETSVTIGRETAISIARSDVARIEYYRPGDQALKLLANPGEGVVLGTGDFMEGSVRQVDAREVKVNSLLFGVQRLEPGRGAAAVLLREGAMRGRWCVRLADGSRIHASSLSGSERGITADDLVCGPMKLKWSEVAQIEAGPDRRMLLTDLLPADKAVAAATLSRRPEGHRVVIPAGGEVVLALPSPAALLVARVASEAEADRMFAGRLVVQADGRRAWRSEPLDRRGLDVLAVPLENARHVVLRAEGQGGALVLSDAWFVKQDR